MLEQESDLSLASGFERRSKTKDFCDDNLAVDSGFLSGPQEFNSELEHPQLKDEPEIKHTTIDTFMDSGAIVDSQIESGLNNLSLDSPKVSNFSTLKSNEPHEEVADISWEKVYRQDNDGDTALHLAIINEIPNIVRKIIRLAPQPWLLDLKNDDAQAPIHLAVLTRQANVVRHLLINGAKASIRDGDGNTALHLACMNDDLNSVEVLLKPITVAELKESNQLQKSNVFQLTNGIDLEQRNFYGEYCIHIAAERNQLDILKLLIREGVDVNAREGRAGYTPLHIAVENKNLELAKFLLEHCKTLNTETYNYRQITAYQLACELGHTEMLKLLTYYGCKVILPPESDSDHDHDYDSDDLDDSDDID